MLIILFFLPPVPLFFFPFFTSSYPLFRLLKAIDDFLRKLIVVKEKFYQNVFLLILQRGLGRRKKDVRKRGGGEELNPLSATKIGFFFLNREKNAECSNT